MSGFGGDGFAASIYQQKSVLTARESVQLKAKNGGGQNLGKNDL
jgi:hypothetical protein